LSIINLQHVAPTDEPQPGARYLQSGKAGVVAVLEGGLDEPRVIGTIRPQSGAAKQLRLFIAEARRSSDGGAAREAVHMPVLQTSTAIPTQNSGARAITARAGQSLLFLLTLLLAGMLLSQLIEEKSNKVIEVLAAAVPIDSIFLGKLLAMLAASLAGIAVWSSVGVAAIAAFAPAGLSAIPPPAVGWPVFILLGLVYFAMSYLLLGAIFLGIGAHASSAREVQTLSMPVTMAQVVIFAVASIAVGAPDANRTIAAAVFPLSSPYVLIARAAELPDLWPHAVAVLWQLMWVALFLRVASGIFRRNVLKSGRVKRPRRKPARA
jgi:ABC-2 type transport system permease protein